MFTCLCESAWKWDFSPALWRG